MTPTLQAGRGALCSQWHSQEWGTLHSQPHWDLLGLKGVEMEGRSRGGLEIYWG